MSPMRVNVGVGPHYADGWTNTEVIDHPDLRCDLLVTAEDPFPFPAATATHVYMGHVLEHVPWQDVPGFLAEVQRVLVVGGQLMVVGPDALRTIDLYRDGQADIEQLMPVIEGPGAWLGGRYEPLRWGADRHHWNCWEARVVDVLTDAGFEQVTAYGVIDDGRLDDHRIRSEGWPLVDGSPRQFAVSAVNP